MSNREEEFLPRVAFASAVSSSQLLGVGVMVMTGIWMGKYRGGFDWDGTEKEFNYHPLFMVIGMVFLNAEGKSLSIISRRLTNQLDEFYSKASQ